MLSTVKWQDTFDFLATMFEEQFTDDLWKIYLSNPFRNQSFNEFKQSIIDSNKPKELIESEAKAAAKNALNLLNSVGGDEFGI